MPPRLDHRRFALRLNTPSALVCALLAALLAAATSSCGGRSGAGDGGTGPADPGTGASPTDGSRPNVLLISIDTTRADALGCYGSLVGATPTLDALASSGVRFETAFAPVPLTMPSHSTMLTGLDPPRHQVRDNAVYDLSQDAVTLAEFLKAAGYRNFASVASVVMLERHGLGQGFEIYDQGQMAPREGSPQTRSAREIAQFGVRQLAGSEPFFGFLHFYDVHQPYAPPADLALRFGADESDLYFAELAYVDRAISRILTALEQGGLRERTLVVVTADHGEGRGDHGEATHGMLLHDATQHIPLIMAQPGLEPCVVRDAIVTLADLTPSILDWVGVRTDHDYGEFDGRSLVPLMRGGTLPARSAYLESISPQLAYSWAPLFAVRNHEWKLVSGARDRLYQLASDPLELRDVSEDYPDQLEALKFELRQLRDGRGPPLDGRTRTLSVEELRQLGGIGYVTAEAAEPVENAESLPDSYELMDELDEITLALALMDADRLAQAIEVLRPLVEALPGTYIVRQALASCLGRTGRHDEAYAEFSATLERFPDSLDLKLQTALAAALAKRDERATELLREATAVRDCPPRPFFQLAVLLAEHGDADGARDTLDRLSPRLASMNLEDGVSLALSYRDLGDKKRAAEVLGELLQRPGLPARARGELQRGLDELRD